MRRREFIAATAGVVMAGRSLVYPPTILASSPLSADALRSAAFAGVLFGSTVPPGMTLTQREAQLGVTYDIQHSYSNGGFGGLTTPPPGRILAQTLSSGSTANAQTTWVQQALAGKLDARYTKMRDEITMPTFSILWQEFNGHWEWTYPGYYKGGFSSYASAWRRLALILRENPNIITCWAPNIYKDGSKVSPLDPEAGYPGDDVVDWLAVDGYCHGTYHSFDQLFDNVIADYGLHGSRHKKPIMIGETAAQKSLSPDKYVTSVHQSLAGGNAAGLVKAVCWFDNPWGTNGYNVDATTAEKTAYKAMLGDASIRVA